MLRERNEGNEDVLKQLAKYEFTRVEANNAQDLLLQVMKKRNIGLKEALECLRLSVYGIPNDYQEQFKKELDVIADMYQDQAESEEDDEEEWFGVAEFLDGLPVIPGLSVEGYLNKLFDSRGVPSEDIIEQLGQELGVSTKEAMKQLRKAYKIAEKKAEPLRLLNR